MKKYVLFFLMMCMSAVIHAQSDKFQLSSHILDITSGYPAADVTIQLSKLDANGIWTKIDERNTDNNGRVKDFLPHAAGESHPGVYKLTFLTAPYFKAKGEKTFYPFVEVVFEIRDGNHYHVPITLSPYGYSTYRGS